MCRLHRGCQREAGQRDKVRGLPGNLRYERFMAVANDRVDAGQRGDLLRARCA